MKKVGVICSVVLFLSFFTFFLVACGGGGGGISAAQGGNNASSKGGSSDSGESTITINPNESPTLASINWQTIDFIIKIDNRAPITQTIKVGQSMDLQLGEDDGLVVGATIDVEAKITNAAGLEFEAFSGVKTITAGSNNIVLTVGRKVPITLPANATVEGGATYVVVTRDGATLPKATTTEKKYLQYWKKNGNPTYDFHLSSDDFLTLTTLEPVFKAPAAGDILCTDRTVAATATELGGRTPFGIICGASGNPYAYIFSLTEVTCKLNESCLPYSATNNNHNDSTGNLGKALQHKQWMLQDFPNIYSTSAAFQHLASLSNFPDGTPVEWFIPDAYFFNCYFKETINTNLNAIGATPLDATAEYMVCQMKQSGSDWGFSYYAKIGQTLGTILQNSYCYYSGPNAAKRLRAIGKVPLP